MSAALAGCCSLRRGGCEHADSVAWGEDEAGVGLSQDPVPQDGYRDASGREAEKQF